MFGTMVLVLMGCGVAVSLSCGTDTASVLGTSFAFGLAVVAMAYTIGGISGCHINPAITLGVLLSGRMSGKDAAMYMIFQVIGAFIGSALLYLLTSNVEGLEGRRKHYWRSYSRNSIHICLCARGSRDYRRQEGRRQLRRSRHWFEPCARTPCMHQIHRHFGQSGT